MPTAQIISLTPDAPLALQVVPGMSFDISFEHPGQDDWRLWDFYCDVRLRSDAATDETTPVFSLTSDDDEITVAQTDDEIEAEGDRWQLLTLRFSSAKTVLLDDLIAYKYDVLAFLTSDPTICCVVFPKSELHAQERVTRVP